MNNKKLYIYQLPFDINKELCRLLDMDDTWKELAGEQMKYSTFDIIEIEQRAQRQSISPTQQLFRTWGQLNHTVEYLFLLLYGMKHVLALRCLVPIVDKKFHKLLHKLDRNDANKNDRSNDENGNIKQFQKPDVGRSASTPLPVILMQGTKSSASKGRGRSETSPSEASSTDTQSSTQSKDTKGKSVHDEITKEVSAIPKMNYDELRLATDDWSEHNLLGKGGFGQVFKGKLKFLPVAVKKLKDNGKLNQELIREMCLNQYRHDNILPLYGYSIGGPEACLVYQLMAGGSLEHRIHRSKGNYVPLTWPQRYRIAHGVARGLHYLHYLEGTPLIHGDIKPANILLDQCLMPKIGDFGLARKGHYADDMTHLKVTKPIGTAYYLPKEYLNLGVLSPAMDVFSFGVVALEIATALPPARPKPGVNAARAHKRDDYIMLTTDIHSLARNGFDLATLEDPAIRGTPVSNPELCLRVIDLGRDCTVDRRQERPSMLDVFKRLDALEFPGKEYS